MTKINDLFRAAMPGLLLSATIALAVRFVSERLGGPAMLYVLLFGMAFNFLTEDERFASGIRFASRNILRFGASAALAIASVLPAHKDHERNTILTVAGVTALSTMAMVIYPVFATYLHYDHATAGVFLGGTIHDVVQVVGAGYIISDQTGEISTVVKLIRVAFLVPVVIAISLVPVDRRRGARCQDVTAGTDESRTCNGRCHGDPDCSSCIVRDRQHCVDRLAPGGGNTHGWSRELMSGFA